MLRLVLCLIGLAGAAGWLSGPAGAPVNFFAAPLKLPDSLSAASSLLELPRTSSSIAGTTEWPLNEAPRCPSQQPELPDNPCVIPPLELSSQEPEIALPAPLQCL